MADESQTTPAAPATLSPEAAQVATPQSDPTPAQIEGKNLVKQTSAEIDDLWSKIEGTKGAAPSEPTPEPADEAAATPAPEAGRQRDEHGRFVKAEAEPAEPAVETVEPVAETPPPAVDPEAIERQVRERIEHEQQLAREAEEKVKAEQQYRSTYEAYIGHESDYAAVTAALRAAQRGDTSLLDALDVVLPNGKRISEVTGGARGLQASEASSLLDTWDQNRAYEDVMGTRKVQQILSYWDSQTQQALASPDVDAAKVREYRTPGEQMQAAIDTTRAAVEKRLGEKHTAEIKAKDAEIERLTQRVASLVNEGGNLASQQRAAQAASPERPGQPGSVPRDIPTPEQLRDMSPEEFFKSGLSDRLFQSLPGGLSPQQRSRRAG